MILNIRKNQGNLGGRVNISTRDKGLWLLVKGKLHALFIYVIQHCITTGHRSRFKSFLLHLLSGPLTTKPVAALISHALLSLICPDLGLATKQLHVVIVSP